jgi:hypothetical protein
VFLTDIRYRLIGTSARNALAGTKRTGRELAMIDSELNEG